MNRAKAALVVLVVAVGAFFLATPAPAPPSIPIFMPTVITTSGTYTLVTNISASISNAIDITGTGVENIVIDLGGNTITVSGGYNGINATNIATLTVRNGTIVDPTTPNGHGIWVAGGISVTIDHVAIIQPDEGIHLANVSLFSISNCTINLPATIGISVDGSGLGVPMQGTITSNQVRDAGTGGILVTNNHDSVVVSQNTIARVPGGPGIYVFSGVAATVDQNRVRQAVNGIELDVMSGSHVTNNSVGGSSSDGIVIAATDSTNVDNNASVNNAAHGARIGGDYNTFNGNRLNRNSGHGIWFEAPSNNNFFQSNVARGNTGVAPGGTCPPPSCAGLVAPNFCNDGTANTSGGNNYMPGPPVC